MWLTTHNKSFIQYLLTLKKNHKLILFLWVEKIVINARDLNWRPLTQQDQSHLKIFKKHLEIDQSTKICAPRPSRHIWQKCWIASVETRGTQIAFQSQEVVLRSIHMTLPALGSDCCNVYMYMLTSTCNCNTQLYWTLWLLTDYTCTGDIYGVKKNQSALT